ncbi:LysR family transcriptional regulator [Ruegeria marisrubri]|uniref:LysR substrate-binding domain-containing protein n=1 Tax=Ruegeria marisrubri TaxID=1685379 RepID=UPI001CD6ED3C|nr:LysR substrate-binding domain-containing protein [Ruegeria marisrubri]MCA0907709.1 LysR family transcriptional regulator [Ruegeria marisrubri]
MAENLRHLRALQAFDETATHSSLTKAADVLNVTHGAISRQIKLLERHLGVTLFHRRPNGVELTKAGERLYHSTRGAFSALQLGVMEVKRLHHRQSITVSLSTSLALKWLVPLLGSFQKDHPGIALLLDTNDAFADFDMSEVDVALRFGEPGWNGLYHQQIRQEELIVVAAPSLVGKAHLPMRPEDVVDLPLLHDAFNVGWESWAAQVGLSADRISAQSIKYVDSAVLLEAAIDGQGVALARHLLAERDLELGRLIRLDESRIPLDRGLYFVCRPGDQDRVTVRIFLKWLMSV